MKKIFYLIGIIVLFIGCSKERDFQVKNENLLTLEDVETIVKSVNVAELDIRDISTSILGIDTIYDKNNIPAILNITYTENNSLKFLLISDDIRTIPLIGNGENEFICKYNNRGRETSAEVDFWVDAQLKLIEHVRATNMTRADFEQNVVMVGVGTEHNEGGPDFGPCEDGYTRCGPIFTHTWSQGCVYNDDCPEMSCNIGHCNATEALTGCAATAMVQVMKYHEYPNDYDWSVMLDIYHWNDFNQPGADDLSDVMALAGQSIDMNYGCAGSWIDRDEIEFNINSSFENTFGYSHGGLFFDGQTWGWGNIQNLIYEEVCISGRPIIMMGLDTSGAGGHVWVCNGVERRYRCSNGEYTWWYRNYMNWGWNGNGNGWFAGWGMFADDPTTLMRIWN